MEIAVDSSALYDDGTKLGLGSSAAVTVAATALALSGERTLPVIDREEVSTIALAAHAGAARAARGSGADVAAAVHGGVIAVYAANPVAIAGRAAELAEGRDADPVLHRDRGQDDRELVARMDEARAAKPRRSRPPWRPSRRRRARHVRRARSEPEIAAQRARCRRCRLAAHATDQLAAATGIAARAAVRDAGARVPAGARRHCEDHRRGRRRRGDRGHTVPGRCNDRAAFAHRSRVPAAGYERRSDRRGLAARRSVETAISVRSRSRLTGFFG